MSKNRMTILEKDMMDAQEIMDAQERICTKVRRIRSVALLDKLEDIINRIYRRGSR